jgi:hypothetical protein
MALWSGLDYLQHSLLYPFASVGLDVSDEQRSGLATEHVVAFHRKLWPPWQYPHQLQSGSFARRRDSRPTGASDGENELDFPRQKVGVLLSHEMLVSSVYPSDLQP